MCGNYDRGMTIIEGKCKVQPREVWLVKFTPFHLQSSEVKAFRITGNLLAIMHVLFSFSYCDIIIIIMYNINYNNYNFMFLFFSCFEIKKKVL